MRRLALSLALALLAVSWAPLSTLDPRPSTLVALAQGEIRVISQSHENRFPDQLVFRLKAEGDLNIQKITFFYRVGPVKSTSYAYPTFTPGRAVEAEYALPTRGARYIVPGSELEYYYEIEDADGAKLKTEPVRVVYEDTRFAWQKLEGDRVTVYYYGQERIARQVLEAAQQALAKMKSQAGVALERPVKAYVYGSKREMDVALPFRSETTTRELVTQGEAFSEAVLVMILGSDPEVKETTAHELTHLLTHQLTDNPFAGIPAWLNEGLSMYAEGELRPANRRDVEEAIRRNTLLSLRAMSAQPGRPELVNLFYGQAYSLVRYLVETYGAEKMSQLLAAFKEGTSADQALKRVYGFDTEGLEARWRAAIGARPSEGAAREGPALPETVPTLVPFGAKPPAPAGAEAPAQTPLLTYGLIAASAAVLSLGFLLVLAVARRR